MKSYIAIDLKSFYASVECVERGLDPLTTNLVVADESRTAKTICLAATSALKSYGIPGRARLFEVIQKVKEANMLRKATAPRHILEGESYDANELAEVTITYSKPDEKKNGGAYVTVTGSARKVEKVLIFQDGTVIAIDDMISVNISGRIVR